MGESSGIPPFKGRRVDEITVSAPNHRVDLEALKRPGLGGKEPSDDEIPRLSPVLLMCLSRFLEGGEMWAIGHSRLVLDF